MTSKIYSSIAAAVSLFLGAANAQDTGNVIPFQGQLANQSGQPLSPTGPSTLVFRLYRQAVGGVAIWEESQPNISVNAGRFGALLGSRTELPAASNFNTTLYLGITVDDGNPVTADVEMRPRQALVPVVSASYAKNADKLSGFDWGDLMAGGTNNPRSARIAEEKLPIGVSIPVGGVIMWWGAVDKMPAGFELCDGGPPTNSGALLQLDKPDLRDRFVKGPITSTSDVAGVPVAGGINTVGARTSLDTSLSVGQIPAHAHFVNLSTSADGNHAHNIATQQNGNQGTYGLLAGDLSGYSGPHARNTDAQGNHAHSIVGDTGLSGSGLPHNHAIPGHDNRPAFLEMFFIIRVK